LLAATLLCAALIGLAPRAVRAQASVAGPAPAEGAAASTDRFAFHLQSTFVYQGHARFDSPYAGANSLDGSADARETWDLTFYGGARLWRNAEFWINPEIDQGFGLSDTLGAAGFPSGEAYKVGASTPYARIQRAFVRQTVDLPGETADAEAAANQFAGSHSVNRLVVTVGKLSVGDIFDTNRYAHDPRADFLNWSLIDTGSFDYAADAWGYSAGVALEAWFGRWTLRSGAFLLSDVPNSAHIDTSARQYQLVDEIEERHQIDGRPGALRLTAFVSHGRMARLDEAVRIAQASGAPADVAGIRRFANRTGLSVNVEQELADGLGAFLRAGFADPAYEAYEFTDIDRTIGGGVALSGGRWGRAEDRVALAGVINEAGPARRAFLAAGGLGILIGDGRLPRPGPERIIESWYDVALARGTHLALDYQWIEHPAYNRERGPVSAIALRLHGEF
jgi:high affinity Mn2+ porin